MSEQRGNILLVDDDPAVGRVLSALLGQAGHRVTVVVSGEAAVAALERDRFDLCITDLKMPGMDGLALLSVASKRWPALPVVMLTAHGTVTLAVEAMRDGATDFLIKPFDREEILYVVGKALHIGSRAQAAMSGGGGGSTSMIGDSPALADVHDLVRRSAPKSATVLIRGESGTGKELVARALHEQSPRKDAPFVKVSCGALPDTLLESELFGYEKGAFTGATSRKPGRVELAEGGTLFLDEIGDITPAMQVKLLRILQEREYERLGGQETRSADVRFVAATHRDLENMVETGGFREDLYYRLSVVPIWLPTLRERPSDVGPLATHFCRQLAGEGERRSLSPGALELLCEQIWPGNVRQLQNFVERLVVLSDGLTITRDDVDRELARHEPPKAEAAIAGAPTLDARRAAAERDAVETALRRSGNNRTAAARLLGVSRRTLYKKLSAFGMT